MLRHIADSVTRLFGGRPRIAPERRQVTREELRIRVLPPIPRHIQTTDTGPIFTQEQVEEARRKVRALPDFEDDDGEEPWWIYAPDRATRQRIYDDAMAEVREAMDKDPAYRAACEAVFNDTKDIGGSENISTR